MKVRTGLSLRHLACALFAAFANSATAEKVALTFDDLPLNGSLPAGATEVDIVKQTLLLLASKQAPPVFGFVNANKLESNPNGTRALQLWVDGKQRVGNHTYSHVDLNRTSPRDFGNDVLRNEPTLSSLTRTHDWRWFRYPYLREGDTIDKREAVRTFLREHHYTIAQTTIDYEDYLWNTSYARCVEKRDTTAIERLRSTYLQAASAALDASRAMAKLAVGRDIDHVLLLHLGAFTPEILPALLDLLERRGFKLATLEEAQRDPIYQTDPQYLGRRGRTLLEQHVLARQPPDAPQVSLPREDLDAICR
jgi:peptidoglycan/xylan/chitin deacetylase (PgdA/CDA1 family)